jgi:transposase-like protein
MSKIKERRKIGAVCPRCKSPDYEYKGRANAEMGEYWQKNGKHEFKCNSCGFFWQYGKTESIYTELI